MTARSRGNSSLRRGLLSRPVLTLPRPHVGRGFGWVVIPFLGCCPFLCCHFLFVVLFYVVVLFLFVVLFWVVVLFLILGVAGGGVRIRRAGPATVVSSSHNLCIPNTLSCFLLPHLESCHASFRLLVSLYWPHLASSGLALPRYRLPVTPQNSTPTGSPTRCKIPLFLFYFFYTGYFTY